MHNLVAHTQVGVLVSWATLGQSSGHHHVNCQKPAYVRCVLNLMGFQLDEANQTLLRRALREARETPWLASTLSVFRRHHLPIQGGLHPLPATPTTAYAERYLAVTAERCPYTPNGCNLTSVREESLRPTVRASGRSYEDLIRAVIQDGEILTGISTVSLWGCYVLLEFLVICCCIALWSLCQKAARRWWERCCGQGAERPVRFGRWKRRSAASPAEQVSCIDRRRRG